MLYVVYALGRICVPVVFIAAGIQKALSVEGIARMLADNRVPVPDAITAILGGLPKYEALGYFIAGLEIVCGLMIMTGLKARWGALILVVFTACTIIFVHHFWDMEGLAARTHQTEALKNLSIIGALLLIVAGGSSGRSVSRRPAA
jgi:putative oxidoreductase